MWNCASLCFVCDVCGVRRMCVPNCVCGCGCAQSTERENVCVCVCVCVCRPAQVDPDIIPQAMLKKYIAYAKQNCRPQLQQADYERIQRVRADMCSSHTHPHPQ